MVDRIEKSFGGECTKTTAVGYITNSKTFRKDFQISIKKSQFLESHFDSLRWPLSNIALIAWDEMRQDLDDYTRLVINIHKNEIASTSLDYQTTELRELSTYFPLFQEFTHNLGSKDWKAIREKLHESVNLSTDITNQIDNRVQTTCGVINDYSVEGFEFLYSKSKDNSRIRIYGFIKGDKSSTTLSIDFFRKSKKIYAMSIDNRLMSIPYDKN